MSERTLIGSRAIREDPNTIWTEYISSGTTANMSRGNAKTLSATMNVYLASLTAISSMLCGNEGEASMECFIIWYLSSKRTEMPDHLSARGKMDSKAKQEKTITHILKELCLPLSAATKGSIPLRIMRGLVCKAFTLTEINEQLGELNKKQISSHQHANGRRDYEELKRSGKLEKETFTRKRFEKVAADNAIHYILSLVPKCLLPVLGNKVNYRGWEEMEVAFCHAEETNNSYVQ